MSTLLIAIVYILGLLLVLGAAASAVMTTRRTIRDIEARVLRIEELDAEEEAERLTFSHERGAAFQASMDQLSKKFRRIRSDEGLPPGTIGALDATGERTALRAVRIVATGNLPNAIVAASGAVLQTVASVTSLFV